MTRRVRFYGSAFKHELAMSSTVAVIRNVGEPAAREDVLVWVGPDENGMELEVFGFGDGDTVVVFHAMPTRYRRKR